MPRKLDIVEYRRAAWALNDQDTKTEVLNALNQLHLLYEQESQAAEVEELESFVRQFWHEV